jgi:hypothetical protein
MKYRLNTAAIASLAALASLAVSGSAMAQAPAAAASTNPVIVAHPTYASIPMQIDINKPAADVWKRIGKFCDIGEWLRIATGCTITSGKDGEFGAVRTVGGEVLVGETPTSYTYTQTPKDGRPYNLYHGTLEIRAVTAKTSRLYYTLFYDNSMLADDAARAKDLAGRRTTFENAMNNMKILAEGGTLPPLPPRPAPAAPAPAAK